MAASDAPRRPKNLVQAIERAVQILEILGRAQSGVSVAEMAQRSGLPKGTVHRLLTSLQFFDFVRQDGGNKHYRLGFKLVELGNLMLNQLDLRNEARPFLAELAEQVGETVHLVVRDRWDALYLDKVEPHVKRSGLQMVSRVGARTTLHSSAVGKVLLSELPEAEVAEILAARGLPRKTDHTIVEPDRLVEHLAEVRRAGFALDDEENETGIRCVGAPIRNAAGETVAAVSVSGPATRIGPQDIRGTLKDRVCATALRISRRLGHPAA